MTIAEARDKCKSFVGRVPRDMLIISILILASSASFGLGYLAGLDAGVGVPLPELTGALSQSAASVSTSAAGRIVASKGGTKYYFLSCAGASRISDANKVWFASVDAALSAGYTLAANCKDI